MTTFKDILVAHDSDTISEQRLLEWLDNALNIQILSETEVVNDLIDAQDKGMLGERLFQKILTLISEKNASNLDNEDAVTEWAIAADRTIVPKFLPSHDSAEDNGNQVDRSIPSDLAEDEDTIIIDRRMPPADEDATRIAVTNSSIQPKALDDKTITRANEDLAETVIAPLKQTIEAITQVDDDATRGPNGRLAEGADQESQINVGDTLKQRFVLVENIGHGGMGTVFKARDIRKEEFFDKNPYVAIKVLNPELRNTGEALYALQREAKKSQTLSHPNIVTVYDFDRDEDVAYICMEYLEGKTLDQIILDEQFEHADHQTIMALVERVARGLAYAHQEGFVHADLKPNNIILTDDSTVKILDFGIAQAVRNTGAEIDTSNDETHFDPYTLGAITPAYASPEMLQDRAPIPADDIYALGCVAYALLTGDHPFTDKDGNKVTALEAKRKNLVAKPIPGLKARYWRAIKKSLSFDRNQRYSNAGEFIDAIKPPTKIRRWMLASIAVLIVSVIASSWYAANQSKASVGLNDLPPAMATLADTIKQGDTVFENGDIDQAHKLYSLAWEAFQELNNIDPRDQFKFKVIIDRRIDRIASIVMAEAENENNDVFRLIQLQLTLEFLLRGDVGTRNNDIELALEKLQTKISRLK
ncbi:hypothetical protein NBRC116494_19990 [Aurantivibrio plasticivorans]